MKKDLHLISLMDLYGRLLTPRQAEALSGYYEFDLSLGELSADLGITRQAVKDALDKAEVALRAYDKQIKLYSIREKLLMAKEADEEERLQIIDDILASLNS